MMKPLIPLFLSLFVSPFVHAQTFLGVFEQGSEIPFLVIAADPETGSPTDPVNFSYEVLSATESIAGGTLANLQLGVAQGSYDTGGDAPGNYNILITGQVADVTAHTYHTYTLVESGRGIASIGAEVAGIDGLTPFSENAYTPFFDSIIATVSGKVQSATTETISQADATRDWVGQQIASVTEELRISTRELSRSRLWFAQNTIDTATRAVPADMPSHIEVQIAGSGDPPFANPLATFFHIYHYPNAATATKASRVIRSATPPQDGTFYMLPNTPW